MTELTTTIGAYDAEKRTVPVTFTSGAIRHTREVNAVLDEGGAYDKAATRARVEQVALGVAHKIALGVIAEPVPDPAPDPAGRCCVRLRRPFTPPCSPFTEGGLGCSRISKPASLHSHSPGSAPVPSSTLPRLRRGRDIVQDTLHVYPFCSRSSRFSPAGYIGGKRNLSRRICAIIEATPHTSYAEPFVGMGGIFLRRARPRAEAINDISGDVVTLFRCLAEHYPYLIDMLRFRVASRAEFERLLAQPPERLTDLQRAVRFLYVQRLAFGGLGPHFRCRCVLARALRRGQARTDAGRDPRAPAIRGDRAPALCRVHPPLRPRRRPVLPRPALLGLRARLRPRRLHPRGLRRARQPARHHQGQVPGLPQRHPGRARNLRPFNLTPITTTYTVGAKSRPARELLISNFPLPENDN
jgi:DNA adenine methylase